MATPKKTTKKVDEALRKAFASTLILRPRITEKTGYKSVDNVYTFDVSPRATKPQIADAVSSLYGVNPIKVAVVTIRGKKKFLKGRKGSSAGGKKAYVYLKKGETIQFV